MNRCARLRWDGLLLNPTHFTDVSVLWVLGLRVGPSNLFYVSWENAAALWVTNINYISVCTFV
jgi:hypothetical protein